jgi:tetratricopeptide (TPR) repeat protein
MRPHHRTTAIVLALVAVVFGVFFRTLESSFLRWDDDINVFENRRVQGLTAENLRWMFTDFEQAIRYKPLSWLAWALVHEIFGLNPFGYHLTNVLLHCANTVLVFLLIRRLLQLSSPGSSRREEAPSEMRNESQSLLTSAPTMDACAAIGALLWAVHPLRVEPVAWVTGLPYGLALLFLLTATLLYLRAHLPDADAGARRRDYWLAVGAFALAVLSYPIVLGYVAALVALDYFPLRRFGGAPLSEPARTSLQQKRAGSETGAPMVAWRSVLLDKAPFLALSLLLVAGTVYGRFHVTGTWDKPVTLDNFPPFARAMQAFYLWACYAWKPLLPLDLCPVYPVLMESRFNEMPFLLSALGVLAVSAFLFAKRRVWPAAFALWLAHLGLLVPMLGLTERPHYPHDRYSIINGILWSVALSGVLWKFTQTRSKPAPWLAIGSALVMLLAAMSWRQTAVWHSDLPFFTDMAAKLRSPHYRSQALLKLGNAQADLGDDAKAVATYREALQLSPASATFHLHFNLGNALARLALWPDALAAYETALRLRPDSAAAYLHLGIALAATGELDRAVEHLTRVLQLKSDSFEAHEQLALVLGKQGKSDLARQHAAEAERLRKAEAPR